MKTFPPRTVMLFYDGYEVKAMPGRLGWAYSNARRILRFWWRTLCRKQTHTGFYTAFLGLKQSLRAVGYRVRVNDFNMARAYPNQAIGVAGYPSVIGKVDLQNPIVFGPGDHGPGAPAIALARQARARVLTQPCAWAVDYNRQWIGDKGAVYFAGIDTEAWPDLGSHPKSVDVLVYDKIRWYREERTKTVLNVCLDGLEAAGLRYRVIRYGAHHIGDFREALRDASTLLFLCEHETQGLAYQEAMSSGLPVMAWDEGVLTDPAQAAIAPPGLVVSSVPYFDARCGLTFTMRNFTESLDLFWAARATYRPRDYVKEVLSLQRSGELYLEHLARANAASLKPRQTPG